MTNIYQNLALKTYSFDVHERWQCLFQDAATQVMDNIIDLHHDIMFFLIVISIFVLYMLMSIVYNFWETNLKTGRAVSLQYQTWTGVPTVILAFIALSSYILIYNSDELIDPKITIKVIYVLTTWIFWIILFKHWTRSWNFQFLYWSCQDFFIRTKHKWNTFFSSKRFTFPLVCCAAVWITIPHWNGWDLAPQQIASVSDFCDCLLKKTLTENGLTNLFIERLRDLQPNNPFKFISTFMDCQGMTNQIVRWTGIERLELAAQQVVAQHNAANSAYFQFPARNTYFSVVTGDAGWQSAVEELAEKQTENLRAHGVADNITRDISTSITEQWLKNLQVDLKDSIRLHEDLLYNLSEDKVQAKPNWTRAFWHTTGSVILTIAIYVLTKQLNTWKIK